MKTILEKGKMWLLGSISKVDLEDLRIFLIEGLVGEEEDIKLSDDISFTANKIDVGDSSLKVLITFSSPISWQVVDESFTTFDEYESRDDTSYLQVITQSRYLDYVNSNHGWYEDVLEKTGKHYRVWTGNYVIDVVSCEPPDIKNIT